MSVLIAPAELVPPGAASACLHAVGGRRGAALSPDAVVDALASAGPRAIALAASAPEREPGVLVEYARLMGIEVVRLPSAPALARWVVAVGEWLCRRRYGDLLRRLQTLAGISRASLPGTPWGAPDVSVPALRPEVLARWAWHAWRRCPHCSGGGYPAAPCPRCGSDRP